MIKKLVSNALLSMVMDKKAREKFSAVQEAKRRPEDDGEHAPDTSLHGKPQAKAQAKAETNPKANPKARPLADDMPGRAPAPSQTRRPPTAEEETEALIREALESAELELVNKRKRKTMTPQRQALIDQAMAIHASKSHILDDLDPEHRDKLTFMAMKALDPDFGK